MGFLIVLNLHRAREQLAGGAELQHLSLSGRGHISQQLQGVLLSLTLHRAAACFSDSGKSCSVVHCPLICQWPGHPCSLRRQYRDYNHEQVIVILDRGSQSLELLKMPMPGCCADYEAKSLGLSVVQVPENLKIFSCASNVVPGLQMTNSK